jgi:hypothetical protein
MDDITIEKIQDFINYSNYIDNMYLKRNKKPEMNTAEKPKPKIQPTIRM